MTEHKPLIGMTVSGQGDTTISLRRTYFGAIYEAGGIPVPLARTTDPDIIASYADNFDAFFFTGGVDVDPKYYGEEVTGKDVEIDETRDNFEFALWNAVKDSGKPILGVCRGIQFLNVARGGSLYQHIEGHQQSPVPAVERPQRVTVVPGTRLHALVGVEEMGVNSFHHQAVKEPAPGLVVTARAEDGTVEALEDPAHPFFLAVQWHPEYYHREDATSRCLFEAFIKACQ